MVTLVALFFSIAVFSQEIPPRNPYLANSHCAMSHCDSAQQNAVSLPGPTGPGKRLSDYEIDYTFVGPIHYSSNTSGICADGGRVMWGHGVDRIVKLDHDTYKVVAEYYFPDVEAYSEADAEESRRRLNENTQGVVGVINALRDAAKITRLPGIYNVLDINNHYYIGKMDGTIVAYADQIEGDCYSGIRRVGEFTLPEHIQGQLMGMNLTFDGWLVIATDLGEMLAVRRDFSEYHEVMLRYSENATGSASASNKGWIQNGFAIDSDNGIYIASRDYMHKVVWTGNKLSIDEADGAWSVPYLSDDMIGTGSTPSLMGFGEEDHLVVITDGQRQMHVTAFWRDAIPDDWEGIDGAPDKRIAGLAEVTMGVPTLTEIQSEQTVVVAGYGAFVVNNTPSNFPWYLPEFPGHLLVSGLLGSDPQYQPFGIEKFEWDPVKRTLRSAWSRADVSSPNAVPLVSIPTNMVYLISARNQEWTLEGLDWDTGQSVFHYILGDQRFNAMGAGIQIDEAGRINYGTQWGRVRINPQH